MIQFFSEGISFQLQKKPRIRKWLKDVIINEKRKVGTINVVFCNDELLLKLNKTYLKHKTYTDILTFPCLEKTKAISGDIFISIIRIQENSRKFDQTFDQELCRVMVHGILHLIGYNDKTKSQKLEMSAKEDHYLLDFS